MRNGERQKRIGANGLNAVQKAWIEHQVPQCGYCQSGFIMAATALLDATPEPTDEQINAAITNLCRCGTYPAMRTAIRKAAQIKKAGA
jgi:isoquinoline 1-oxidoreductase subunit alpha